MPHRPRKARIAWLALTAAAVLMASPALSGCSKAPAAASPQAKATVRHREAAARPAPSVTAARSTPSVTAVKGGGVVLSAGVRSQCPATATACADLSGHLTWLQSGGKIIFGPVRMEPGGDGELTPRGIFHVAWKAGPHYISTSYGVPIPYAVFFAADGVAFHAGSLTKPSHGCIHLTLGAARYYNQHLPVGAEVAVF